MDEMLNPQIPSQDDPEQDRTAGENSTPDETNVNEMEHGEMTEEPAEETQETQTETSETYHSSYDSYRFRSPDQKQDAADGSSDQKSYNANQYGHRDDQSEYGYHHQNQDGYVNYTDPVGSGYHNGSNHPKKPKSHGNLGTGILLAAVFGVVAAVSFFLLVQLAPIGSTQSNAKTDSASSESEVTLGKKDEEKKAESGISAVDPADIEAKADEEAKAQELTIPEVAKKAMPSMVAITNTTVQQYQDFFGETYDRESVSAGSGIIVGETDSHLLIATNNHVISGSTDITVTFVDESAIAGVVQGTDADNDLAIVSVAKKDIPDATMKEIAIVEIGDSDGIQVGDQVVAIGNALGYGQSASAGIVSAVGREVSDSDGTTRTVIQTDAAINPGNSGGALLNMKGELIGINEAKLVDTTVEGVGYAIPTAIAEPILTELGNKASREKVSADQASYLGITCVTMPSQYTSSGYPAGVYVASIEENGPAAQGGLKKGDIITSFDGASVSTKEELISALDYYAAGESVTISVSRMNRQQNAFDKKQLTITLGSKKEAGISSGNEQPSNRSGAAENSSEEFDSRNGYFGGNSSIFDIFR